MAQINLPALAGDVVDGVNRSVKKVNGVEPDQEGNVTLPDSGTSGTVTSVNGVEPDESGNVTVNATTGTLRVEVGADFLAITQGYTPTHDYRVQLGLLKPNYLPQLTLTTLVPRDGSSGTNILAPVSDWFGPYSMRAQQNITGDNPTAFHFTGGTHGYSNGTTGTPTARNVTWAHKVNGQPAQVGYAGPAHTVETSWTNRVQASNTKLEAGGGREVLEESYRILIDGSGWHIEQRATFLEPVTLYTYYGLQATWADGPGRVLYHTGNAAWVDKTVASDSGTTDRTMGRMSLAYGQHRLEMTMDPTYWLGRRTLLPSYYPAALTQPYGSSKSYFQLVRDAQVAGNTSLGWRGGLRFWSPTP